MADQISPWLMQMLGLQSPQNKPQMQTPMRQRAPMTPQQPAPIQAQPAPQTPAPVPQIPEQAVQQEQAGPQSIEEMMMVKSANQSKQFDKIREKYMAKAEESLNQQSSGIDQLQEGVNQFKAEKPGVDWSPMASYIDFLNKGQSNFASDYNKSGMKPMNKAQRNQMIQKMQQNIQGAKDKLTKNELNILKAGMDLEKAKGAFNSTSYSQVRARGQDIQVQQRGIQRHINRQKDFEKFADKLNKGAQDDAKKFNQLEDAFARNDYQSMMSNLAVFARAVSGESGVLTDHDIGRVLPKNFQGGVAKFTSMLSGDVPTADLPPNFTKVLKELTDLARNKTREKYKGMSKLRRENMEMLPMYEGLRGRLTPAYDNLDKMVDKTFRFNEKKAQPQGIDDKLKRLQELRAKQVGG